MQITSPRTGQSKILDGVEPEMASSLTEKQTAIVLGLMRINPETKFPYNPCEKLKDLLASWQYSK